MIKIRPFNMYSKIMSYRTFKNFGHKREPVPMFTFLWHGFLTFTFIGMGLEWKKMARLLFGEDSDDMVSPIDPMGERITATNE